MFEDHIRRRDIEVENDKICHNRQMELMACKHPNQNHVVYNWTI